MSAIVAWLFEDELDDEARAMAAEVLTKGAIVPALFRWELQNALLIAVRRGRISQAVMDARLEDIDALKVVVDLPVLAAPLRTGLELARRFELTSYDASYLELAARLGRLLMTRDQRLAKAADEMNLLWRSGA